MNEVTHILNGAGDGNVHTADELLAIVYRELRALAAAKMAMEAPCQTLQATALVHELYLKLLNQKKVAYEDRGHFYTFAAKVMRRILIDHARGNQAQIRGGGSIHVPLSNDLPWVDIGSEELLELNRALDELNAVDAYKVRLVELRYFLGCTADETAALMGTSKATVDREMRFIKSWLYRRLHPESTEESS